MAAANVYQMVTDRIIKIQIEKRGCKSPLFVVIILNYGYLIDCIVLYLCLLLSLVT